jgi:hypothetical protein
MTQIYLVGTDHNFQKGHGCYREGAMELKQYINDLCGLTHVEAIGEEMNRDALVEAGVEKSICEMVADELGLKYCMCDPDRTVRQTLGIRQENDIRLEGFHRNWKPKTIQKKISEEYRKREEIWLIHVQSFCSYPVLFVCGANHVRSFSSLLESKSLRSEVLAVDWAPNN